MIDIIFEILFEGIIQLLIEMGFESVGSVFLSENKTKPVFVYSGLFLWGIIIGSIFSLIFLDQITPNFLFSGISLIISPICAGIFMHYFASWRKGKGKKTTIIASFWGGAIFSFSFALARILII